MSVTPDCPTLWSWIAQRRGQLLVWSDRYSQGVWAMLADQDAALWAMDPIAEALEGDDETAFPVALQMQRNRWFPIALAPTAIEALNKLEARLAVVPPESMAHWEDVARGLRTAVHHRLKAPDGDMELDWTAAPPAPTGPDRA